MMVAGALPGPMQTRSRCIRRRAVIHRGDPETSFLFIGFALVRASHNDEICTHLMHLSLAKATLSQNIHQNVQYQRYIRRRAMSQIAMGCASSIGTATHDDTLQRMRSLANIFTKRSLIMRGSRNQQSTMHHPPSRIIVTRVILIQSSSSHEHEIRQRR